VTYFLDNTFSPQFAASLRAFGHEILHLLEVPDFSNKGETKDEEWMPYVGERGWITLTGDRRIATARRLREIFLAPNLTTFFMPKGYSNLKLWPQYQLLVRAWEQIAANAERAQRGDCFEVTEGAKVILMPKR
jgi:hypothetical protein